MVTINDDSDYEALLDRLEAEAAARARSDPALYTQANARAMERFAVLKAEWELARRHLEGRPNLDAAAVQLTERVQRPTYVGDDNVARPRLDLEGGRGGDGRWWIQITAKPDGYELIGMLPGQRPLNEDCLQDAPAAVRLVVKAVYPYLRRR